MLKKIKNLIKVDAREFNKGRNGGSTGKGRTAVIMEIIGAQPGKTVFTDLSGDDQLNFWRANDYLRGRVKSLNLIPTEAVAKRYAELYSDKFTC